MILKALKAKRELNSAELAYMFEPSFLSTLKEMDFFLSAAAAFTIFDLTLAEQFSKSMADFPQFRQLTIVSSHMQFGVEMLKSLGLPSTSAVILANCVIGVYGQLPRAESLVQSMLNPGEVDMSNYADYAHIWNDISDVLVVVQAIYDAFGDPRACSDVLDAVRASAFMEIIRRAKRSSELDPLGNRDFVSWKPLLAIHVDQSNVGDIEAVIKDLDNISQSLENASSFSALMGGVPTVQQKRSRSTKKVRGSPTGGAGVQGGFGSVGKGSQVPGQGWGNRGNRGKVQIDQEDPDDDVKCSHCRRNGCVVRLCCAKPGVWSTKVAGRNGILRPGTSCHFCGIFGHRADQCGQSPDQQKVTLPIMAKWWADTHPSTPGSVSRGRKKKSAGLGKSQPAAGGAAQVPGVALPLPPPTPPSVHPAWLLPPPGAGSYVAPAPPQQAAPLPGTMFVGQPSPTAPAQPVKESFKLNGKIFQEV